ncbi:MAG: hypothetical protein LBL48_10285 [Azoarcus sp.]|nr:hypothetical protein [Azoarcus sp.]
MSREKIGGMAARRIVLLRIAAGCGNAASRQAQGMLSGEGGTHEEKADGNT